MAKYYVNSYGITIILDTKQDVSSATTMQIRAQKPSGKAVTWTAERGPMGATGTYTKIQYTVQSGDWDEAGYWTLQAYIATSSWAALGDSVKFKLEPAFS